MAALVHIQSGASSLLDPALLDRKEQFLFDRIRALGRVLVAYSGGTDSAYLAWAADRVLGDQALALTADSPSLPRSHKHDAIAFAAECGFRHELVETNEFDNPDYVRNDQDRCFHCKDELFARLQGVLATRGFDHVIYGVNRDDLGDYRPGQRAAALHGVKAPLVDADLSKAEIRELARRAGLSAWNRPAAACLSSRVPYGTPVTRDVLQQIEAGEEALKALGFRQFRVRFHGELVRLEFAREEMTQVFSLTVAAELVRTFKALGFHYVTFDLEGYRQGSMNEVLPRSSAVGA